MRPIDADVLDKKVYNDVPIRVFGSTKKMAAVRQLIEEAPTIDVRPVVHGHWIPPECPYAWYKAKCSLCGYEDPSSWGGKRNWHPNDKAFWKPTMKFCPNCGNPMDEEVR